MFVIANLLNALAYVLNFGLTIYMYIVIARAIISWVNPDPYNPIVNFLVRVTDPVLDRVRRMLPDLGGLDLSPLIVLLAIFFMQKFVIATLFELAHRL
ncbi:MAG: YggT family protein [Geobacteraceae bacterium]